MPELDVTLHGARGAARVRPLGSPEQPAPSRLLGAARVLTAPLPAPGGLWSTGRIADEERRRIARELHDSTGQNLGAAVLDLEWAFRHLDASSASVRPALSEALALCRRSLDEIRTLSYRLHPPVLEQIGLVATLRWYRQLFARRTGIRIRLRLGPTRGRLPHGVEWALFRVAQEALDNVRRHARTSSATVELIRTSGRVVMQVTDRGRGMRNMLPGQGILGMRERVRACGGELEITNREHGICVRAVIPLGEAEDADPVGGRPRADPARRPDVAGDAGGLGGLR
jgi:signal transduction histidine kinase